MKYEMKHAAFEEMFQAMGGRIPESMEELTDAAHQNIKTAVLLPFYVYCFHPLEWQEYTLSTDDPLPSTLNHAARLALDAPALHADREAKRYFCKLSALVRYPSNTFSRPSLEEWTYYLCLQYCRLYQKTSFFESRVTVKSHNPKDWLVKITL